jgi:hypothetical protein
MKSSELVLVCKIENSGQAAPADASCDVGSACFLVQGGSVFEVAQTKRQISAYTWRC